MGGVYHEEDLLQPLNAVLIPGCADVDAARLAANKMLRQQHDEALRGQRHILYVHLISFTTEQHLT